MPITRRPALSPRCSAPSGRAEVRGYARASRQASQPVYARSVSGARTSLAGWLARMGFTDVPRAERELAGIGIVADGHPLLTALARAADPGLALAGVARIAERDPALPAELASDGPFRARLV